MASLKLAVLSCLMVLAKGEYPSGGGISSNYGVPSGDGGDIGGYHQSSGNQHHYHQEEEHYEPKPYEFGYAVKDHHTGTDFGQQETSDGHNVKGQYRVLLPDGRVQIVTYTADWKTGFHADVKYEGEAHYPTTYGHNNNNNNNNHHGGSDYSSHQGSDYGGSSGGYNTIDSSSYPDHSGGGYGNSGYSR